MLIVFDLLTDMQGMIGDIMRNEEFNVFILFC